jgi:hypothetical protein
MGADKIFVLILSLAFAAFVGYLMWHSRKAQANVNPAEPPAGDPKPDEPTAGEAPAAGRKARNRARRK